ncbi:MULTISPECIES: hypothetical protein [Streptococcus]|jgi:hypothetical protein|uniref:hypothetical protein n=1 Tax=Streptococcus TaxID=1301 RepID=UPI00066A2E88|nr:MULTISPECIES: hypothetical protein [Streptococcus]MDU6723031.1 hypothetical protein [Streptococcus mitis]MBN6014391.1 hypothetical protein [Streptococcus oralis subsp. oralis]MCF1284825.1 hypothetical protein [Streptococcus sinensis]MCY7073083.1 hypothetical protein [Streptococcus oralis]MCY7099618.1 hypothetical protein [Streptococcus oralis]
MVTRKSQSEILKGKIEKYQLELEKIQDQKTKLLGKERKLTQNLNTAQADYIVALMNESGKSIEELERFAKETNIVSKTGGDSNVQNY